MPRPPLRHLLVATTNPGKLREMAQCLDGLPVKLLSLADVGSAEPIEERGDSFAANAALKALHYSHLTTALTLADDSGLEVEVLGGAPGVQSARYGGPGLSDEDRCQLLLKELQNVPPQERRARFRCALALAQAGSLIEAFEGSVEGVIANEPRGGNGFGYDPIFVYPPYNRTFAAIPPAEKNAVSHRGRALAQLREYLRRC